MVNQNNFKFIIIGEDGEHDKNDKNDKDDKHSKSETQNNKAKSVEVVELNNNGYHIFMFIFMDGCGHCEDAKPAWHNLKNLNLDNVALVLLNQKLLDDSNFSDLKNIIGKQPIGFPAFKYIHKNTVNEYNDGRDETSFKKWIHEKTKSNKKKQTGGRKKTKKTKKMKKTKKISRRKWSAKYKKSINCKRPKGFSQKQYCKYGVKK
jgi:hypothetical protein